MSHTKVEDSMKKCTDYLSCNFSFIHRHALSIVRVFGPFFTYTSSRTQYSNSLWQPEGKRPLGKPTRRWEDNIKIDLQEVGGGCGDWMELAQDRDRWRALVSTVRNFRVPKMRGIS